MKTDLCTEEYWPLFASAVRSPAEPAARSKPRKVVKAKHALANAWAARKRMLARASRKAQQYWQEALLPE
ncbi:MAG: hypothetical protein HZC54_02260 [Verrucomicrobia bacterium]|nr:hypothetical protein [Verrucomicrobiota bacterium]